MAAQEDTHDGLFPLREELRLLCAAALEQNDATFSLATAQSARQELEKIVRSLPRALLGEEDLQKEVYVQLRLNVFFPREPVLQAMVASQALAEFVFFAGFTEEEVSQFVRLVAVREGSFIVVVAIRFLAWIGSVAGRVGTPLERVGTALADAGAAAHGAARAADTVVKNRFVHLFWKPLSYLIPSLPPYEDAVKAVRQGSSLGTVVSAAGGVIALVGAKLREFGDHLQSYDCSEPFTGGFPVLHERQVAAFLREAVDSPLLQPPAAFGTAENPMPAVEVPPLIWEWIEAAAQAAPFLRRARAVIAGVLIAPPEEHPPTAIAFRPPLRVLSLGGGGVEVLAQLQFLLQLETNLGAETCLGEHFDYIVGSGSAAFFAVWLGQGKRVQDMIQLFKEYANIAFHRNWPERTFFARLCRRLVYDGYYPADDQRVALEERMGGATDRMRPVPNCKPVVYAKCEKCNQVFPMYLPLDQEKIEVDIVGALQAATATFGVFEAKRIKNHCFRDCGTKEQAHDPSPPFVSLLGCALRDEMASNPTAGAFRGLFLAVGPVVANPGAHMEDGLRTATGIAGDFNVQLIEVTPRVEKAFAYDCIQSEHFETLERATFSIVNRTTGARDFPMAALCELLQ